MNRSPLWAMGMSLAALTSLAAAAGPEIAWPTDWVVFGPVPPNAGRPVPDRALLQSAAGSLTRIPGELTLGRNTYPGRAIAPDAEGQMDLGALFGGAPRGSTAFLLAPLKADRPQTLRMGAGANWWMQWWLDGKPVYDTLAGGNRQQVIRARDHLFDLVLTPGEHVLAAAVVAGKTGFTLTVAGPRDAQPKPLPASAASGVTWPDAWTAFGPGAIISSRQTPDPAKLLAGDILAAIPKDLEIGGKPFPARTVRLENGRLDLARQLGVTQVGQPVYLLAPVTAASDTTVTVGAGAGGWMKWWLDGKPVYDTFWGGGNGPKRVTGTDHAFDLTLSRGAHVLAVAVASGLLGNWEFAVVGPDEWRAQPSVFKALMEAGQRQCVPAHWSLAINYPVAQGLFRRALGAAAGDAEKAAAGLALADARLEDFTRQTDLASIRANYEAVLALTGAGSNEQARALLGIGETLLREKQYENARKRFTESGARWSDPVWAVEAQFALARSWFQERRYEEARREFQRLLEMDGVDPERELGRTVNRHGRHLEALFRADPRRGLGWEAWIMLEGMRLAPQVWSDHPRLFFNADSWPAVKARALGPQQAQLETMKKGVLGFTLERIQAGPRDWGMPLMDAAFAYRVTGEPELLERVRAMLRSTMDYFLSRAEFNASVYTRLAAVAALDWVWNELPPAEREALARDLNHYVYSLYRQLRRDPKRQTFAAGTYYEWGALWYAGLFLTDPAQDDVDYARVLTVLGQAYASCLKDMDLKLQIAGDDGGSGTPLDYLFGATCTRFWSFLHCWQSALSGAVDPAMANLLSPDFVLRNVLGVTPGHVRNFGYTRAWRNRGGLLWADLLPDHLAHYIHLFGKTHPREAGIAVHLRRRMAAEGTSGYGQYSVYPFMLNPDGEPPAAIPDGMPIARHFEGVGQILMSSGFGDTDTYALYACGGNLSEADYDLTHFTIYKQGYLALDSGTRAQGDISMNNYAYQTVAHNGVLIHMPGEQLVNLGGTPIEANSGGQRAFARELKPLAFESVGRLYAYMANDATPTYHADKCAQMVRQFLYLPPDHFVVFDRVIAKKAEFPKTWLLHTGNEPQLAGREFRADEDRGRIYCRTLLPADAVLEKIGGPGKEFWADGKNWPIPENSIYLRDMGMTNAADVPENVGRWRVEVTPGAARESDCFLHLIQVGDPTLERMAESRLDEGQDWVELAFPANGREVVVRFRTAGEVGGHIRIVEGGQALADQALTREIMPQSGLALVK